MLFADKKIVDYRQVIANFTSSDIFDNTNPQHFPIIPHLSIGASTLDQ